MFDRITFALKLMGGRARIRVIRIPVSVVERQIAHVATVEEVLEGYPVLEHDGFKRAIEYAAWRTEEKVYRL